MKIQKMRVLVKLVLALAFVVPMAVTSNVAANGGKVTVCHNGHEITVSQSALDAHLRHGDRKGSCAAPTPTKVPSTRTPCVTKTATLAPTQVPTTPATVTVPPTVVPTQPPTAVPTQPTVVSTLPPSTIEVPTEEPATEVPVTEVPATEAPTEPPVPTQPPSTLPAATPDPGYGGVPLCQNPGDTDCVPDPGPKPQGGKIPSDIVEGEWNCVAGTIPTTVISYIIIDYYVGSDNLWHPITTYAGSYTFDRSMKADELAECGSVIVTDPIDGDATTDSGEVVEITPEPVATEDLIEEVPVQVVEADQPAETPAVDETTVATDSTVMVTSLPNTGSGMPDGSSYGFLLGISAAFALAGTALRRRA